MKTAGRQQPLVAQSCRPFVWVLLGVSASSLLVLCLAFHGSRTSNTFDDWVLYRLLHHIDLPTARAMLGAVEPPVTSALLVAVVAGALVTRRWKVATFTVTAPLLALAMTEVLLKPAVDRGYTLSLPGYSRRSGSAFPSGHETALSSLTIELAILVLTVPWPARWRATCVAVLAFWTAFGCVALTRNFYHYASDTVGAVCVSGIVVLGVALVLDQFTWRS